MTKKNKKIKKNDIKESDVDEFVEKLKSIILEIVDIDIKKIKLNVCRFDYKVDVPMEDKERYTSKENNDISIPITKNDNKERRFNSQVVYPIISDGDTIGTVILLAKDKGTKMTEVEQKVVQSAASFLGSQMEI